MTTTEQELTQIRSQISTVRTKKARAEVEVQNAKERLTAAQKALVEEFKVTTGAEAKETLAKLEEELEQEIQATKAALAEAGA